MIRSSFSMLREIHIAYVTFDLLPALGSPFTKALHGWLRRILMGNITLHGHDNLASTCNTRRMTKYICLRPKPCIFPSAHSRKNVARRLVLVQHDAVRDGRPLAQFQDYWLIRSWSKTVVANSQLSRRGQNTQPSYTRIYPPNSSSNRRNVLTSKRCPIVLGAGKQTFPRFFFTVVGKTTRVCPHFFC